MNQSMRPHFNSVFDVQINNLDLIVSNFVINGKVKSLHRVIKYVKEVKVSFEDFSARHTPCESFKRVLCVNFGCIFSSICLVICIPKVSH